MQLEQRLRIEQQFIRRADADSKRLQAGHSFSLRTRYQAQLIYNFREESGTKSNLALFLRDEVYTFPFGQEVFLSQNRSSLGMIFQPFEKLSLEPSYMLMLLQPGPSVYEYRHVINLSFIHFLNL